MGQATAIVTVVLSLALLPVLRAVMLTRMRGSVSCYLRPVAGGRKWRRGVARYAAGEIHWIPLIDIRMRPRHAIARRGLVVSVRRLPTPAEGLPEGFWVVDCGSVSVAMSEDALTGFLSWLEAAPPGAYLDAA
ncbi:DUF2550 domain-containing protein [Rhizohabitans arisaemae]|uniref:DUF2550 domain-containing protein n=1 Tax=Rhizohabitans arisaemae TaxID=2720610 RepID=UPI0024B1252D|nr:DUF2550 domain-containing protein [Rhizohabitans arisaemae]